MGAMISALIAALFLPIQERFDLALRTGGAAHSALLDSVAWEITINAPVAQLLAVEELAPLIGWDAVSEVQREIILWTW